jgi:hypothetical protein
MMAGFFFALLIFVAGIGIGVYVTMRWLEPTSSLQGQILAELRAMRSTHLLLLEAWRIRRDLRREGDRQRD